MLLEEFLEPLAITQAEIARRLQTTPAAINEIVKARRGVSAEMAWRLSWELGTTPELWLNLQMSWDLWRARGVLDTVRRRGRRRAGRAAR